MRSMSTGLLRAQAGLGGLPVRLAPAVLTAIRNREPIVALESTIISHGMPFPQNLSMAKEVETIVSEGGATPATIAIIKGEICVGLGDEELHALASAGPTGVRKVSTRDIPTVVARKGMGATTVAATMRLAQLAGIDVFVTGGIGGVHRGAETTWDVSADLTELGRTPVTVICAGVKSILDIPATLEYLETQGVPVFTYTGDLKAEAGSAVPTAASASGGQARVEFPAFFSPRSGVPSPDHSSSLADLAAIIAAGQVLGHTHGTVIGVPNPAPAESAAVEAAIQKALAEAAAKSIAGRDVTPFILKRVNELTSGASLVSNIALVKHNAAVGARLAVKLNALQVAHQEHQQEQAGAPSDAAGKGFVPQYTGRMNPLASPWGTGVRRMSTLATCSLSSSLPSTAAAGARGLVRRLSTIASTAASSGSSSTGSARSLTGRPIVVGGAVMDMLCKPLAGADLKLATSNPGVVTTSFGGVGRNVAEAMARVGLPPVLVTSLGAAANAATASRGAATAAAAAATAAGVIAVASGDSLGESLRRYCEGELGMVVLTPQLSAASAAAAAASAAAAAAAPGQSADAAGTAVYVATLDGTGELVAAIADMKTFDALTPDAVMKRLAAPADVAAPPSGGALLPALLPGCPLVVVDANVPVDTLAAVARAAATATPSPVPLVYETTSIAKCTRVVGQDYATDAHATANDGHAAGSGGASSLHLVTAIKPNAYEVVALATAIRARMGLPSQSLEQEEGEDAEAEQQKQKQSKRGGGGKEQQQRGQITTGGDEESLLALHQRVSFDSGSNTTTTGAGTSSKTAPDANPWADVASALGATAATIDTGIRSGVAPSVRLKEGPLREVPVENSGADADDGEDEADDEGTGASGLHYGLVTAAQTVLAAMIRPSGMATPLSPAAAALVASGAGARDIVTPPKAASASAGSTAAGGGARDPAFPGGLVEGRKHVLVSLGKTGVFWVSAPPAASDEDADRLLVLPFFAAAQDPALKFDFTLCPAPEATMVKCTGAGDTFVGTVAASIARGLPMGRAIRLGLAASKIAVESPAGQSTIPARLSRATVESVAEADVALIDEEYAD